MTVTNGFMDDWAEIGVGCCVGRLGGLFVGSDVLTFCVVHFVVDDADGEAGLLLCTLFKRQNNQLV